MDTSTDFNRSGHRRLLTGINYRTGGFTFNLSKTISR
ncbi:unnamed protein product [Amoebophrya sp. A120]|nr:unnamed protein product [Amoebophrya sp. A120]|eukprot:GSA120T00012389001.1